MQLIEMTVSGGHVRLLYANAATKDDASEWLGFECTLRHVETSVSA